MSAEAAGRALQENGCWMSKIGYGQKEAINEEEYV
jgi:hypothetical protein